MELTKLEYEAEKYKTESDTLRNENSQFRDEMQELQSKLQELDVAGGQLLLSYDCFLDMKTNLISCSVAESLGATMEQSQPSGIATEIYDRQISELKLKISKLERDNQTLRSSSTADSSEKEATLNTMLDEAKQTRETLEQNMRDESIKSLRLADQVKGLEKKLQDIETRNIGAALKAG